MRRRPVLHPKLLTTRPVRNTISNVESGERTADNSESDLGDTIEECEDDDRRPTSPLSVSISQQEPPEGCMSVQEVDEKFRPIFPYPYFNKAQSQCFNNAYYSDENMVVSGKFNTNYPNYF